MATNVPLPKVRFKLRKSTALTKIVVSSAVVLSVAALLTLHLSIRSTRQSAEELRGQAVALEQRNSRLELYISQLGSVDSVERIAREMLDMVDADSIIIQPE